MVYSGGGAYLSSNDTSGLSLPIMEFGPMLLFRYQVRGGAASSTLCYVRCGQGSLWRRVAHLRTLSLNRVQNDRVVGLFLER
jgi:hypothetical protein